MKHDSSEGVVCGVSHSTLIDDHVIWSASRTISAEPKMIILCNQKGLELSLSLFLAFGCLFAPKRLSPISVQSIN